MVTNLCHKKHIFRAPKMNMLTTFVKGKGICPQESIITYENSLQTTFLSSECHTHAQLKEENAIK